MKLHDKIYTVAGRVNFILHILLFAFVAAVGFLPFCEDKTFYTYFNSFFIILLVLLLSCVTAFFAIKRPILCVLTFLLTLSFFVIVVFPNVIEGFVVGLVGATMSEYKIGFQLMNYASYIIYLDLAFALYSTLGRFIIAMCSHFKKR